MADYTRLTNLEVTGEIRANNVKITGEVRAVHKATTLTLTANHTLTDGEKMTESLKVNSASAVTLTLAGEDGQTFHVVNTNASDAITLKNVSGDSGTSLAAGKIAFVFCSTVANQTKVCVLN